MTNNCFNSDHSHRGYRDVDSRILLHGDSHHNLVETRQVGYREDNTLDHSLSVVDQLEDKEAGKSQTFHHEEDLAVPWRNQQSPEQGEPSRTASLGRLDSAEAQKLDRDERRRGSVGRLQN